MGLCRLVPISHLLAGDDEPQAPGGCHLANAEFHFRADLGKLHQCPVERRGWQFFQNSLIVAVGTTALALLLGIPTAYVLARYRFFGNADYGFWILSTRMTPPVAMLIPFFVVYVRTGLFDTYIGLILAHVAITISIVVWLMKGFFEDLPSEMEEAAFMDGATPFEAFLHICLPVALPGIAAVAILTFLFSWNEFLFSLVLADRIQTVPVGLYNFVGYQQIRWGELSASAVIMLAPVLLFVFVFQRQLVRGLTLGRLSEALMTRKLRSHAWFGEETKDGFVHRSWMKNNGLPDDAFDGGP